MHLEGLYVSRYAMVAVSSRRYIVVELKAIARSGNPMPDYWTPSVYAVTPPVSRELASTALLQLQEDEAQERVERAAKAEEYEKSGRSPYGVRVAPPSLCPVCHREKE